MSVSTTEPVEGTPTLSGTCRVSLPRARVFAPQQLQRDAELGFGCHPRSVRSSYPSSKSEPKGRGNLQNSVLSSMFKWLLANILAEKWSEPRRR